MAALTKLPKTIEVNRSKLRQDQSNVLKKAIGKSVVVVKATSDDAEKYIVDKEYFEEIIRQWRSAVETLEIAADTRLFNNLLRIAGTIDKDLREGKLHTFEEAFK
ncbi:MAG: hypothetical protein HY646_12060 [Acidobacteria bacterium]|nr:hypothetical protein [Acidobacteriota bacterium]